jgi:hypothetical protein
MNVNRFGVAVAFLMTGALPVFAQNKPRSAELPVTRIVLFTSGVGYFQRDGQVDGNARIDLSFHTQKINDLLKSLVLQDRDGGRISTVNYDNRDPIDKTLKSFAIDLTRNPTLGQLLDQVRGEKVETVSYGEMGNQGRPTTLTGVVLGVEKRKKALAKDQVVETEYVNLLTAEGIRSVPLDQLEHLRLLKPELEQEFRRALEVLATGHDKQKKTVTLNFQGNGKRNVRVAYVTESPMWKTSYRLALDKDEKNAKTFLQGWGIVENTSDEDWDHVRLGLVSGRPISFQMDLYEPLYVPRPMVEPELFASLRPPAYSGNLGEARNGQGVRRRAMDQFQYERDKMPAMKAAPRGGMQPGGVGGGAAPPAPAARPAEEESLGLQRGVASAAVATELGEYFKYEIEQPVTLPRQKSALIPIVNGPVEASKVSIYNEGVQAKFPLLGLRFKNTTGLHLMQGPITIFEGNTYAGDGRINDLQPNETRLVSYAVDLGTEVAPEVPNPAETLVATKIYKGILHATYKVRHRKIYTVKNRSEHGRLVLIEYPYHANMKLVTPEKPAERARDVYRFQVDAEPNKPVKLEVVEEEQRIDQVALTNADDETVRFFLRSSAASSKVKEALDQAIRLKSQWAATQRDISREEQELQKIVADQTRMRENMKAMPQTSDAYRRYLKKFDAQETEIEQRREKVAKLQETAEAQRRQYETFVLNLEVE